jgi:hypothetical protein
MPAYTLKAPSLAGLALEIARRLKNEESALPTPLNNVTIALGENRATISASLPVGTVLDSTNADLKFAVTNYTNHSGVITTTGTPIDSKGVVHTAEALTTALYLLDAGEEAAKLAGKSLPSGVGTDYAINGSTMSINCVIPITYSIDGAGQLIVIAEDYLTLL